MLFAAGRLETVVHHRNHSCHLICFANVLIFATFAPPKKGTIWLFAEVEPPLCGWLLMLKFLLLIVCMLDSSILYDSENASVMYMKRRECLYIALEGFLDSESFVEINSALAKGVTQSEAKRFLFDTSKTNVISNKEMQWLTHDFLTYITTGRVSKVAFLKPDNIFGDQSVGFIATILSRKTSVRIFPSMELAESWLYSE